MELDSNNQFKSLLQQSPTLRMLLDKTAQLNKLNQAIRMHLDPDLAEHCKVANLEQGRLILTTSSPAWNHRLRFLKSDLLSSLRKQPEWCGLIAIESIVQHFEIKKLLPQQALPKSAPLPHDVSCLLTSAADQVSSGKLANALLQLAACATTKT